jgi:hypothetical protein
LTLAISAETLSETQIRYAVANGKRFNSRSDFLKEGLKQKKVKIEGRLGRDSTSKYITFYDDLDVISAAVAEANQKMRDLTAEELHPIPISGLLFARVEIHAGGLLPIGRVSRKFMDGNTHLVLKIGDAVVQPVQAGSYPTPPKTECYDTLYLWSVFGTYNFAVSGLIPIPIPCGQYLPSKIAIEFAFRLSQEQVRQKATAILIDGTGKRYPVKVDLAKLRPNDD